MRTWSRGDKIAFWSLLVAVVSCGAAIAAIPGLRTTDTSASATPFVVPPVREQPSIDTQAVRLQAQHDSFQKQLLEEQRVAVAEENLRLYKERIDLRRDRMDALAREMDAAGTRAYNTVSLSNQCGEEITVAIDYMDLDGKWVDRGWWRVPASSTVLSDIRTKNHVMYFYGTAKSGLTWNGQADSVSLKRSIPDERFEFLSDDPHPYPNLIERVFFKRTLSPTDSFSEYTQTFTCNSGAPDTTKKM